MKTHFIADGKRYRTARFGSPRMSVEDRNYLRETTKYVDKIWTFFTPLQRSIPDVSMISISSSTKYPRLIPSQ
jgi:hypothetical protein